MQMAFIPSEEVYEFSSCAIDTESESVVEGEILKIKVTLAEVKNLQLLLKYAVPSLLGW